MLKRDFLEQSSVVFNEQLAFLEDEDFITRLIVFARKAMYVPVVFYAYRQHSASAVATMNLKKLQDISLLAQYVTEFERVEMVSDFGWFTPLYRTTTLDSEPGQQVSLFSLYPNGRISVSGLRYPIEKRRLLYWWEATLNEATGKEFTVILEEDAKVLVYRTFSSL